MLQKLDISNYALIENVSLNFQKGFTAITGETGAGKSILLKALNLLLGDRADTSVIKQSEKKCVLEAHFNINGLELQDFFEEYELDYDSICIVRREFSASGKSRGFINDTPVQMTQLKDLGETLLAIHSQHETLALLDKRFQLDVLDAYAGISSDVKDYRKHFNIYRDKVNEQIQLKVKELENRKEKDYLAFLITELEMADLENTDLESLREQHALLENAEKITEGLNLARSVFDNDTYGPQVGIKTLLETFEELKEYNSKYADLHARILSLKIELDDISSEVDDQQLDMDLDEADALKVKEKMDLLNSLTFKHSLSEIDELIALHKKLQDQLDDIDSTEERIEQLGKEIDALKNTLQQQAGEISKKRLGCREALCQTIGKSLTKLGMTEAELMVSHQPVDKLGVNGLDEIEFQFKTNKGGQFLPIKKVASGGELSRLMLSILSLLSEHKQLPTMIFDEIDTGVSGEIAAKIAAEFKKMGNKMQIIAITHLPQVAAKGDAHFHVYKESQKDKTVTAVVALSEKERIDELAKMISGEKVTEAAKENAVHLLNKS